MKEVLMQESTGHQHPGMRKVMPPIGRGAEKMHTLVVCIRQMPGIGNKQGDFQQVNCQKDRDVHNDDSGNHVPVRKLSFNIVKNWT